MSDVADLEKLIISACQGDRSSQEALLLYYHDPLLRFISRSISTAGGKCLTQTDAEDLLQETLVGAFRGISKIEPRGSTAFFAWLKTIARSKLIKLVDARRAQKRGGIRLQATSATSILKHIAGKEASASVVARRKEAIEAIAACIADLRPAERQIINLRFGKGMSAEEIAGKIGKGAGAVKMIINRTIKELRENLERDYGEFTKNV